MNVRDFVADTAATPNNRNIDNDDDPYCVLHGPFFFRLEIDPSFGVEISCSSSSDDNDDNDDRKGVVKGDESCENDHSSSPTPPRVYLAENRWNDGTPELEGSERLDLALASTRKNTFLQSSSIWNEHSLPRIDDMVKAGFVYTGAYDGTYCFSCEIMIYGWSSRDDPLLKHVARSSTCKFAFRTLLAEFLEKQNLRRQKQRHVTTIRQRPRQNKEEAPRLDDEKPGVRARLLVPRDDGDNRNGDDGYGDYDEFTCERSDDVVCASAQLRRFASERDRYLTLKERVRSFRRCEWCEILPSAKSFADSGFYYVGPFDETRCISCCRTFINWSKHDSPWLVHAKLSPNCPYVSNGDTAPSTAASTLKMRRVTSNDGDNNGGCDDDDDDDNEDVNYGTKNSDEVAIVEFIDERRRVESFLEWAIKMADAGFYFTGHGDAIRCYVCGGILNKLYEVMNDVNSPRDLHAFWFPHCRLSRETK